MVSKPILTTDESYDSVHASWVTNGRPRQFDRAGKEDLGYGGAVYRVLDNTEENPIFYQYASRDPTTWDEDNKGKATKGWDFINEEGWFQSLWITHKGVVKTDFEEAPNEL